MNEIQVKSGIVVKVNENGDTIKVNVEDQLFISRFLNMTEKINQTKSYMETEEVRSQDEQGQINALIEKTKEIMVEIDSLFGENACKKVFGDIIPNPYLLADFFEQLTPIVEQYMDERQKKISEKYNNRRKGANH